MANPKVEHVREAARHSPGNHTCHWPGCKTKVPPAMWGCKSHWFRLPSRLRALIWRSYVPGQEVTKRVSNDYVTAAREVQAWIAEHEGRSPDLPLAWPDRA